MVAIPMPDVSWGSLVLSLAVVAGVVLYSDVQTTARFARLRLAFLIAVVLLTVAAGMGQAVYFDYDCTTAWWWEYYCW